MLEYARCNNDKLENVTKLLLLEYQLSPTNSIDII